MLEPFEVGVIKNRRLDRHPTGGISGRILEHPAHRCDQSIVLPESVSQFFFRPRFPVFAFVGHFHGHAKLPPKIEQADDLPVAYEKMFPALLARILSFARSIEQPALLIARWNRSSSIGDPPWILAQAKERAFTTLARPDFHHPATLGRNVAEAAIFRRPDRDEQGRKRRVRLDALHFPDFRAADLSGILKAEGAAPCGGQTAKSSSTVNWKSGKRDCPSHNATMKGPC